MTINNTFNQASGAELGFEGNELFQSLLSVKDVVTEALGSVLNQTSIDYDFFSQIFNVALGERGNKDVEQDLQESISVKAKEKENDGDNLEMAASNASETIQEQQEERLMKIGDFEFTDVDLKEALQDIIKDKDAFAEKHGLTEKQADQAEYHAMMMLALPPEEREAYLRQLEQTDPEIAHAIGEDAEIKHGGREIKRTPENTAEVSDINYSDQLASKIELANTDLDQSDSAFELDDRQDDFALDTPEPKSSTFTLDM